MLPLHIRLQNFVIRTKRIRMLIILRLYILIILVFILLISSPLRTCISRSPKSRFDSVSPTISPCPAHIFHRYLHRTRRIVMV